MTMRPPCSTMKRRPEPSGASDIQTGRSKVSAGKVERSWTLGKDWAETGSHVAAARQTARKRIFGSLIIEFSDAPRWAAIRFYLAKIHLSRKELHWGGKRSLI